MKAKTEWQFHLHGVNEPNALERNLSCKIINHLGKIL